MLSTHFSESEFLFSNTANQNKIINTWENSLHQTNAIYLCKEYLEKENVQVISNDVSAIQPEIWSTMVQVPLYKSLVAMEVANTRLSSTVKYGDTVHVPRFGSLSAQTYSPGTTITATAQDWAFDNLVVSAYKHVTFYVDDPRSLTVNVDQARELASEAAYQLRDKIDQHVFANITGADGFAPADDQDLLGGAAG
jgi:hypothetical protein